MSRLALPLNRGRPLHFGWLGENLSYQWFRFYNEFASDPKIQMLSEKDQRRFVMLLCLRGASESVHSDNQVAFHLRISDGEWQETKKNLAKKNLINKKNHPTNWDKRQYKSDTSAERTRRWRRRHGDVTVTPPEQNRTEQNRTDQKTNVFSNGKEGGHHGKQKVSGTEAGRRVAEKFLAGMD